MTQPSPSGNRHSRRLTKRLLTHLSASGNRHSRRFTERSLTHLSASGNRHSRRIQVIDSRCLTERSLTKLSTSGNRHSRHLHVISNRSQADEICAFFLILFIGVFLKNICNIFCENCVLHETDRKATVYSISKKTKILTPPYKISLLRWFGLAAFVFGLLYALFHCCYGRKVDRKLQVPPFIPSSIIQTSRSISLSI